jgi:hypothetical protein
MPQYDGHRCERSARRQRVLEPLKLTPEDVKKLKEAEARQAADK